MNLEAGSFYSIGKHQDVFQFVRITKRGKYTFVYMGNRKKNHKTYPQYTFAIFEDEIGKPVQVFEYYNTKNELVNV